MEKVQASRDAFEASIRHDRPRLMQAWLFLALFLGPFFVFASVQPDIGPADLAICVGALLAMAFNIVFLPRHNLYRRYHLLVVAATLAVCLWSASALLGTGAAGLSADRLPWITPLLPIALVYAHCFQSPEDADRVSLTMGLVILGMLVVHFGFISTAWTVSSVWMLLFCTIGLLQIRLALWLQVLVHNAVHEKLSRQLHQSEQRLAALRDELDSAPTSSSAH